MTLLAMTATISMLLSEVQAEPGDTVRVFAKDTIHWSGYGGYFTTAEFPDIDEKKYRKIWLKATLGCPSQGCSQWDYTTMFDIMKTSGKADKERYLPAFKVNNEIVDSVKLKLAPVYHYVYEDGELVDSFEMTPLDINIHDRSPDEPVQTFNYWQADTVYDYNRQDVLDSINVEGNDTTWYYTNDPDKENAVDTHFAESDTTWRNTIDTIRGEAIEIGRAATPYSGRKQQGWTFPWYFDVTDYQNLMDGEKRLRAFYRGPRDGFTIKMEFIMIEGTPPRDPVSVQNIYNSPETGFYYSFDTSDINNDQLVPTELTIPENAEEGKIRVSIKGHGFGEEGNCAEFCRKYYKLFLDDEEFSQEYIWRNNCDMTPIYPQTGTWILSRTNWCPGMVSYPDDHDITDLTSPGESFNFEMNMEPHQFDKPDDNDYTDPRWVTDVQFITYGEKNFTNDVAVERIIAPSDNPNHGRHNPICDNAIIEIKNTGSETLNSASIEYGNQNGPKMTFDWKGELSFMESDTVNLPPFRGFSRMFHGGGPFEVRVSNPNGQEDENELNNHMTSTYEEVPEYPKNFIFNLKTNKKPPNTSSDYIQEIGWSLKRHGGSIIKERKPEELDFETEYNDTFNLRWGCYTLELEERKDQFPYGDGDGLDFFCCGRTQEEKENGICAFEGCGKAEIRPVGTLFEKDLPKFFEENFGRKIHHQFTVGYQVGKEEPVANRPQLNVYPNPAGKELNFNLKLSRIADLDVQITSVMGKQVKTHQITQYNNEGFSLGISDLKPGVYVAKVNDGQDTYHKRFIKQ